MISTTSIKRLASALAFGTLIAAGLDLLQGYFFGRPSAEFIEPARTTFD